ncbi:hypothetical protein V5799_006450 [Amblyomma americanum]|uniref:Uncharacterized protein n=1 Tax=Amblyomma americanum TaxID=6943 RepID=A0AAQ4DWC1_AMBAM
MEITTCLLIGASVSRRTSADVSTTSTFGASNATGSVLFSYSAVSVDPLCGPAGGDHCGGSRSGAIGSAESVHTHLGGGLPSRYLYLTAIPDCDEAADRSDDCGNSSCLETSLSCRVHERSHIERCS